MLSVSVLGAWFWTGATKALSGSVLVTWSGYWGELVTAWFRAGYMFPDFGEAGTVWFVVGYEIEVWYCFVG